VIRKNAGERNAYKEEDLLQGLIIKIYSRNIRRVKTPNSLGGKINIPCYKQESNDNICGEKVSPGSVKFNFPMK
jgi:hypothetical protein